MDNYIVSARKYRPTTFDSVVGQSTLTTTLKNAIATGKLAHAFLFCGPRGVGKTTCARIFATTINCEHPTADGEACNECESCRAFAEQRSLNIYELDAASNNSVDDMRMLIEQVQVPPQVGRYKVFIIDEVHMLTTQAFNAFLKTLEEPPAHAIFILATTEKHKILPTILSRCQIYDFNRMEVPDIVNHLKGVAEKEGIAYEEEALSVIARKADGGMRDALSIFDQVASFSAGNITYKKVIEDLNILDYDYYFNLTDSLLKGDIPAAMLTFNEILRKGFEGNHFIGGLAAHFRDLLVSRDESTLPLLDVADNVRQRYSEQAKRCKPQFLYRALKLCNDCDVNYRVSRNKRLGVELCLIEVAQSAQEDAPGCGLGPTKTLKPIFAHTATKKQEAPKPAVPKPAAQSQPSALDNGQAAHAAGALQNAPTQAAQQNAAQQAKRPEHTRSQRRANEALRRGGGARGAGGDTPRAEAFDTLDHGGDAPTAARHGARERAGLCRAAEATARQSLRGCRREPLLAAIRPLIAARICRHVGAYAQHDARSGSRQQARHRARGERAGDQVYAADAAAGGAISEERIAKRFRCARPQARGT